ncbi:MAG: transposase [Hormoscilla sp. SP12CHS1]|nr:transposase [Hormoscilla sp. SP12CHS1]
MAFSKVFTMSGQGFPRFKKKGLHDTFYLEGNIKISGNRIKLPKIGWVKAYEKHLPPILFKSNSNVTISCLGGGFISYKVDVKPEPVGRVQRRPPCRSPARQRHGWALSDTEHRYGCVGVDLGIKTLANLSNGKSFPAVKAYRKAKRKIARLQRAVSRKVKGSNNRKKAIRKLQKAHHRVACIRNDATHKLTTYLAKNHSEVVIEYLNVSGMMKNHRLAQAIADCG